MKVKTYIEPGYTYAPFISIVSVIEPGYVYAPYIPIVSAQYDPLLKDNIIEHELRIREVMQDYRALGYPDLLDHATELLRMEINLRIKKLIKKHCS